MSAQPETATVEQAGRPWLPLLAGAGCGAIGTAVLVSGVLLGSAGAVASSALLQAGLLVSWWRAMAPAGPVPMLLVAGAVAVAADVLMAGGAGAGALTGVLALGVVATIVAQLARGVARTQVVQSYAGTLVLCALAVTAALLAAAVRVDGADPVLLVVLAAGAGLVVARLVDLVLPWPPVVAGVGRGGVGLLLAAVLGGGLGVAYVRVAGGPLPDLRAGLLAAGVALVAVLVDLAGLCLVAEQPPRSWSFGLAPLLALVAVVAVAFTALPSVVG